MSKAQAVLNLTPLVMYQKMHNAKRTSMLQELLRLKDLNADKPHSAMMFLGLNMEIRIAHSVKNTTHANHANVNVKTQSPKQVTGFAKLIATVMVTHTLIAPRTILIEE